MNKLEQIVKDVSQKISTLDPLPSNQSLMLPEQGYGAFCLKILSDFVEHHNLPKNFPMPVGGLAPHVTLSRIFDIILVSMGEEKRQQAIKDLADYSASLPPPPKKSRILIP